MTGGDIIGLVNESVLIKHKIMVPPNVSHLISYFHQFQIGFSFAIFPFFYFKKY